MDQDDQSGFLTESDSTEPFTSTNETFEGNYLQIEAYTDAAGNLDFSLANPGGGEFDVAGLQVEAIPEPDTYGLLLGGLGASAFFYRRRQLNA